MITLHCFSFSVIGERKGAWEITAELSMNRKDYTYYITVMAKMHVYMITYPLEERLLFMAK